MAKCIRIVGQGVPIRTTDDEAFQIVERNKDGEYCSKSFWREWHADKTDGVIRSGALLRLSAGKAKSGYVDREAA
jgi:hypothetical protein